MAKQRKARMPDPAELAFSVMQRIAGETPPELASNGKDPAVIVPGRKVGKVKPAVVAKKERSETANKTSRARRKRRISPQRSS